MINIFQLGKAFEATDMDKRGKAVQDAGLGLWFKIIIEKYRYYMCVIILIDRKLWRKKMKHRWTDE